MTDCTDVSHSKCYCMRMKPFMILKVVQDEPFSAQHIPASFIHGAQYSIPHIKTLLEKKEKDVKIMNALSYYGFARKSSRESVT